MTIQQKEGEFPIDEEDEALFALGSASHTLLGKKKQQK